MFYRFHSFDMRVNMCIHAFNSISLTSGISFDDATFLFICFKLTSKEEIIPNSPEKNFIGPWSKNDEALFCICFTKFFVNQF